MKHLCVVCLVLISLNFASAEGPPEVTRGECLNGLAGELFPCGAVALLNKLDLRNSGIKAKRASDIWGWTDSQTGKEYAIVGMNNKTAFVDISDPVAPIHLGDLKTQTVSSVWRDIKVYKDHAYIVSEARGHGMQVFDLTRLRTPQDKPIEFTVDTHYKGFGSAHNIVINEDSGFAYAVGSNTCDRGMHVVDIRNPIRPRFSTCIDRSIFEPVNDRNNKHGEGYTHDAQCVNYKGPDIKFLGKEICFCANADTVNIVDVTDKSAPYQISVKTYNGVGYTHQGWLTEDHRYFLLGDETDEMNGAHPTKTLIWDMQSLESPSYLSSHWHSTMAIDHNMYVRGNYVYQANYDAGLRVLDLSKIGEGKLQEVAFFDSEPSSNVAAFKGAWSIFPYYKSDVVVLSNTSGHLFILRPNLP